MLRLFILVLILLSSLASAQLFDSIGGTLKDADIGNTLGTTPATVPAPADTSLLTYTPDPAVTEQVLQQFIDSLKAMGTATPEQMTQFEEALRTSVNRDTMQQFIDQLFPNEGLKLENVADVFSIYLIASFVVLNDLTNGTSTEQDMAVRNQVVSAFSSVPEIQQLSDADKQKFSEALILYVIFLANDWQQAQQGIEGYDLNTVKTQARDMMVQVGIDPAQFDFTPQGLIRKGGNQTTQTPQSGTTPQQTTTPQTTTQTSISPEIQAQVDAMTPEQIQEMAPQCQQLLANREQTQTMENGAQVLSICEAIIAKTGGTTTPTTTQQTPTTTQENPTTPDNSSGTNPLAGGTGEPFVGTFSGTNITLVLQGSNNTYTGELQFNGQSFPVQATANGTNLTGTFTSGSNTFNFTATLQDKALTFVSDGNTFNMQKQ